MTSLADFNKQETTTEDVKQETTTEDVKQGTTTEDVKQETTTEDVKQETTTEDVKQETTTEDVKQETTTEDAKQETTTEDVQAENIWEESKNIELTKQSVCDKCLSKLVDGNCPRCKTIEDNKQKIIELLKSTKREGVDKLIDYLENRKFFTSPASSKFHGNYSGALAEHCLNIYNTFKHLQPYLNAEFSEENLIICAMCHDICKINAYNIEPQTGLISFNKNNPKGHAKLSIMRTEQHIQLTDIEREVILYHMGMYGTKEFSAWSGEYNIKELGQCFNTNKIAKMFYFCDDLSAQFLEKTV